MALRGKQWPLPASRDNESLYRWAEELIRKFQTGWHRDFSLGSVQLTAGTVTALNDVNLLATSVVTFTPTNAAARTLGIPAVTAKANRSFTLSTPAAAGSETYDYVIHSIPAA